DPRVVPAARRISSLSYEETQELAEAGARVLNAQAVEFAKEQGIAIYARATASPLPGADPSADGTVVRRYPPKMPGRVVGVAGEQLHATPDHLALVVSRENLHEGDRMRASLRERFGGRVRLVEHVGAVSVIGAGINASFENLRRGCGALHSAGIMWSGVATSS